MQNKIISFLKDKTIAILGFGLEGKSTFNFIRKHLPTKEVTILDKNDIKNKLEDKYTTYICGEDYFNYLKNFDVIIKSPGISFKNLDTKDFQDKIYSQLELLLMVNKKNVIGITGTKGKSTTTTLIYNVIKEQKENTFLAGNIGIPIFDEIDNFNEESTIVIEMSSHQLEFVRHSPHIGIILNLYEDHLDHAGSVKHYHECKMHMFNFQETEDIAIYCSDNENLQNSIKQKDYQQIVYNLDFSTNTGNIIKQKNTILFNGNAIYIDDKKRSLLGDHNLKNIGICCTIANLLHLDLITAKKTIDSFQGLEHRLEKVGTFNSITFYNDTIATIPEATISGIEALQNVNTLIFGGMDRGIDYQPLILYLNKSTIKNLICMPSTGYKVGKEIKDTNKQIYFVETLDEAVKIAKNVTEKNTICLLSPAASSYEYFKNFEEKGNRYKELVRGK